MRAKIYGLSAIYLFIAALLCGAFWAMHSAAQARLTPTAQNISRTAAQNSPSAPAALLPDLQDMRITALSVSTPERSFQFYLDTQGAVSVNGQQADSEIFSTLLEQIEELPAERRSAFNPQAQDLLLTLVISDGRQEQTVRFYGDGSTGEKAHILLGSAETPEYRQTNAWRVGKLMMTCEGTRILDIYGNETPARP